MEKGIKSRRKILEVAFKLFAAYSYPDVSYSLLEEASGISRGSMVYYFNNKEGIFRAVLETFLFDMGSVCKVPQEHRGSLKEFYNYFLDDLQGRLDSLKQFHIPNLLDARFSIERSALQFVPEFRQHERELIGKNIAAWEEVISHAKASGELRADVNVDAIAHLFQSTGWGWSYMGIYDAVSIPSDNVEKLRELFNNLYSLVKAE